MPNGTAPRVPDVRTTIMLYHSYLAPSSAALERAMGFFDLSFANGPPLRSTTVSRWGFVANQVPLLSISGMPYFDVAEAYYALAVVEPSKVQQSSALDQARENLLADWTEDSLFWAIMAERWSTNNSRAAYSQVVAASAIPPLLRPVAYPFIARGVRSQLQAQGSGLLNDRAIADYVSRRLDDLEAMLAGSQYLMGKTPGLADFLFASLCSFAAAGPSPCIAGEIERRPRISEHCRGVCRLFPAPYTDGPYHQQKAC